MRWSHVGHHFLGSTAWSEGISQVTGERRTLQTSQCGRGSVLLLVGEALTSASFW